MQPDEREELLPLTRDEHGRLGVVTPAATVSISVVTGVTREEVQALNPLRCAARAERVTRPARRSFAERVRAWLAGWRAKAVPRTANKSGQ